MIGDEKKLDFDIIARNIFGADAERFKQMAQGMNQNQINEIMMKFQNLPQDRKQQFLREIQNEVSRINKNPNPVTIPTGVVKGRW